MTDEPVSVASKETVKFKVGDSEFIYDAVILEKYFDVSSSDNNDIIPITECNSDSFEEAIEMLITNSIKVTSTQKALEYIGLSEQLNCRQLYRACDKYLSENYKNAFLFKIYEHGLQNNLTLAKDCLNYLLIDPEPKLKGEVFQRASLSTLVDLCSNKTMVTQHITVLLASLIEYAKTKVQNGNQSKEEVRQWLRPAIRKIPFLILDVDGFMVFEDIDYLLTKQESIDVLKRLSSSVVDMPRGLSSKSWITGYVTFMPMKIISENCPVEQLNLSYLMKASKTIYLEGIVISNKAAISNVQGIKIESDSESCDFVTELGVQKYILKKRLKSATFKISLTSYSLVRYDKIHPSRVSQSGLIVSLLNSNGDGFIGDLIRSIGFRRLGHKKDEISDVNGYYNYFEDSEISGIRSIVV